MPSVECLREDPSTSSSAALRTPALVRHFDDTFRVPFLSFFVHSQLIGPFGGRQELTRSALPSLRWARSALLFDLDRIATRLPDLSLHAPLLPSSYPRLHYVHCIAEATHQRFHRDPPSCSESRTHWPLLELIETNAEDKIRRALRTQGCEVGEVLSDSPTSHVLGLVDRIHGEVLEPVLARFRASRSADHTAAPAASRGTPARPHSSVHLFETLLVMTDLVGFSPLLVPLVLRDCATYQQQWGVRANNASTPSVLSRACVVALASHGYSQLAIRYCQHVRRCHRGELPFSFQAAVCRIGAQGREGYRLAWALVRAVPDTLLREDVKSVAAVDSVHSPVYLPGVLAGAVLYYNAVRGREKNRRYNRERVEPRVSLDPLSEEYEEEKPVDGCLALYEAIEWMEAHLLPLSPLPACVWETYLSVYPPSSHTPLLREAEHYAPRGQWMGALRRNRQPEAILQLFCTLADSPRLRTPVLSSSDTHWRTWFQQVFDVSSLPTSERLEVIRSALSLPASTTSLDPSLTAVYNHTLGALCDVGEWEWALIFYAALQYRGGGAVGCDNGFTHWIVLKAWLAPDRVGHHLWPPYSLFTLKVCQTALRRCKTLLFVKRSNGNTKDRWFRMGGPVLEERMALWAAVDSSCDARGDSNSCLSMWLSPVLIDESSCLTDASPPLFFSSLFQLAAVLVNQWKSSVVDEEMVQQLTKKIVSGVSHLGSFSSDSSSNVKSSTPVHALSLVLAMLVHSIVVRGTLAAGHNNDLELSGGPCAESTPVSDPQTILSRDPLGRSIAVLIPALQRIVNGSQSVLDEVISLTLGCYYLDLQRGWVKSHASSPRRSPPSSGKPDGREAGDSQVKWEGKDFASWMVACPFSSSSIISFSTRNAQHEQLLRDVVVWMCQHHPTIPVATNDLGEDTWRLWHGILTAVAVVPPWCEHVPRVNPLSCTHAASVVVSSGFDAIGVLPFLSPDLPLGGASKFP